MDRTHKCEVITALGFVISVQEEMWIFEGNNDFLLDCDVDFCPFCGKKMKEILA